LKPDDIVQLLRNRDDKGMEALFDQYSGSLFGIITRIIPQRHIAEDVLQRSFIKIWDNIDKYDRSAGTLFTWISVIARNTALDHRKSKSFQEDAKTGTLDNVVYTRSITLESGSGIDVAKMLDALEDKYRIVLEYAYLRGYTQQEISETLEIPLGTVKTRLRMAIGILRDYLKNEKTLFLGGLGIILLIIIWLWI